MSAAGDTFIFSDAALVLGNRRFSTTTAETKAATHKPRRMTQTDDSTERWTFTVVMPVLNARRYLKEIIPPLLDALARVDGELVVMDNGSTDGSFAWLLANAEGARVESAPDLSIGGLRNAGARLGSGRVLSFVDSDCLVPPDYFERIRDVMVDSGAEAVGSDYTLPDDARWIESDWDALNRLRVHPDGQPVTWLPSGNFACLREAFDEVGGYDEQLVTGEDTELCLRLRNAGSTVWGSDDIAVQHLGNPKSLRAFYRKQWWHALGMFGTARREWFDRPTLLTIIHIVATAIGLVLLATLGGWTAAALLAGLTFLSPVLAVGFRIVQSRRPRSLVRALLLFHLYLDARAGALATILLGRSKRRSWP
jgi:glycosyltransferase involved in cell wall biosynthesis